MHLILIPLAVEPSVRRSAERLLCWRTINVVSHRRYVRLLTCLVAEHAVVYDHNAGDACIGVITRRWRR